MEIVLYPDPRLRRPCEPVEAFDEELASTVRKMFEVMYLTEGVGLAAPQVGISRRLLVYNPEGDAEKPEGEIVLANPRILSKAKETEFGEEGCLSFPGIYASVDRARKVALEAQDLQGRPITLEIEGWNARIFLHEFDHLDGILFVDRMTPADKGRIKGLLQDLESQFAEAGAGS